MKRAKRIVTVTDNAVAWGDGDKASVEAGLRELSLAVEAWRLGLLRAAREHAESVGNATARRGAGGQDTALAKLSDGALALARVFYHLEPRR